jgi:hypothetical protein
MLPTRATALLALLFLSSAAARGAGRTDVVTLVNGDRITGEIEVLDRGQLQFKTDDAGTIMIQWVKIVRLEAIRQFELVTSDGRRFLGSLGPTDEGRLLIVEAGGVDSLPIPDVTGITPIGESFWKKLDGSLGAGFTYTKSSGVAQTNLASDTVFRRPAFSLELTGAATLTQQSDHSRSDQGSVDFEYVRYRGRHWLAGGSGRLETNESLGLALRSQVGGLVGYRFVNTNRAQLVLGGGAVVNREQGVDTAPTENVEGMLSLKVSYYTYDRPKTTFDATVQYYPSLSEWGRQRLQTNASVKRELWRDFYIGLNGYDTFDSAPPTSSAANNDIGIVGSVSWTYGR